MNQFSPPAAILLVFAMALGAGVADAQQASTAQPQGLAVTAVNLTAVAEAERGAPRPDAVVRGGDVVDYRVSFTNTNAQPVRRVVLSNPIPNGFRLLSGSISSTRDDVRTEFSADGGRTFSTQPMEEVVVEGRTVRRPVPMDRYTNVRWTVEGWIAPNQTVQADFQARLAANRPAENPAVRATTPIIR
jgi:uncharacterized repeat protein (TIGR01451 family)